MNNLQNQKINEFARKFANYYKNNDNKNTCKHTWSNLISKPNLPSKVDFRMESDNRIVVYFGKNGWGLSSELKEIGEFVERLSKSAHVYIEDVFVDSIDDTYEITFKYFYF